MVGDRPNILVILTDEERERIWWPSSVRLPNHKRLAARGVSLHEHQVHTAPCSPSRGVILAGRHTAATGVVDNVNFSWQDPLPVGIGTWGTRLGAAGYRCAYKGKWHLGGESFRSGLQAYGFDDWDPPDVHGAPYAGHVKDAVTAYQARRWLRSHADDADPCLLVGFVNPDDIMLYPRFRKPWVHDWGAEPPGNFDDDLGSKPETQRHWIDTCDLTGGPVRDEATWRQVMNAYIDLHMEVDRHIGGLLDTLDAVGCTDDTVVVLTSDHGDLAGAHGLRQKGPTVYREQMNVPLTVAWPGVIPEGTHSHALTGAIDLTPTLCAIAGVVTEGLPGVDLGPLHVDPSTTSPRREVLFTSDAYSSMGPTVRHRAFLRGFYDGRWKYARSFEPGRQQAPLAEQELELYDTREDPAELRNLAHEPSRAGLLAECDDRLYQLIRDEMGPDDLVRPEPHTWWRQVAAARSLFSRLGVPGI